MVRKKQKKKQVRVQRRRRLGLILLHVFLLFAGGCMGNRETVYAKELAGDERTIHGDVTAEDLTFSFASPGMRARAITGQEPDVSLEKSARWTDIEEGYAELTITEQDTAVTSNIPVDYIFILDRTRTMSLNEQMVL